nr:DEAD/DEAH box helicase [bacterium]
LRLVFSEGGRITLERVGKLTSGAEALVEEFAPMGILPSSRFWVFKMRMERLDVVILLAEGSDTAYERFKRERTVILDGIGPAKMALWYRGSGKGVERIVKRVAPRGFLHNPLLLGRVAKELQEQGVRLAPTKKGRGALVAFKEKRKITICAAGGRIEVRHHPMLEPNLEEICERFAPEEVLFDARSLHLLSFALEERGGWVEVETGAWRLARLAGTNGYLAMPSERFLHQIELLPSLTEEDDETREGIRPYLDQFGTMKAPKALPRLAGALEAMNRTLRVGEGVEDLVKMAAEKESAFPDILRLPLLPHQEKGAAFLTVVKRGLLGDEMGLGKTVQAIAAVKALRERGEVSKALIVVPASLRTQWAEEIQRFTGEEAVVVRGTPKQRKELWATPSFWRIVNYEILLRDDGGPAAEEGALVLDECQRVKNWRSKTTRAVQKLKPVVVFGLTGTPLENNAEELYTVVRTIDARVLGTMPYRFRRRYLVLDHFGGVVEVKRIPEMRRRIEGIFLRRKKEEVLKDLPPLLERVHRVGLPTAQFKVYRRLEAEAKEAWSAREDGEGFGSILEGLLRMREACDDPALVGEEGKSGKWEELSLLLEGIKIKGKKVLLFTEWTRMAKILSDRLTQSGWENEVYHGGLSQKERDGVIEAFLEDSNHRVLVATDAAAHGLNLQGVDLVVNYELPFNPAKLAQRIARAHRIGIHRPVLALHLVAEGTVEERVLEILDKKRDLFSRIVDGQEEAIKVGMGMEEMLASLLGKRTT